MTHHRRFATVLILIVSAGMLSLATAGAGLFPPQDLGRTDATVSASLVTVGDELHVHHSLVIGPYPLRDWRFGVQLVDEFAYVGASADGGTCALDGDWVICEGAGPVQDSAGVDVTLRATALGDDIALATGIQFSIAPDTTEPQYYGNEIHPIDVTADEVYTAAFGEHDCAVLAVLAPDGIDSDLLRGAAEVLTRGAEAGHAQSLAPVAAPDPISCSAPVRIPADELERFAWGAARWGVDPEDYAQVSTQLIVAIIRLLVSAAG